MPPSRLTGTAVARRDRSSAVQFRASLPHHHMEPASLRIPAAGINIAGFGPNSPIAFAQKALNSHGCSTHEAGRGQTPKINTDCKENRKGIEK